LGTQMGARNMDRRGGSQSMSLAGMWWRVARRPSRMVGLSWVSAGSQLFKLGAVVSGGPLGGWEKGGTLGGACACVYPRRQR